MKKSLLHYIGHILLAVIIIVTVSVILFLIGDNVDQPLSTLLDSNAPRYNFIQAIVWGGFVLVLMGVYCFLFVKLIKGFYKIGYFIHKEFKIWLIK